MSGVLRTVLFGFLLHDWRWGLTFAVLAGIADIIYRRRGARRAQRRLGAGWCSR
jgi:hypothetical protein